MSHFTVLVMGENVTDDEVLDRLMKPYHEFECTGINEYIVEEDQTEDARASYEKATKRYIFLADGTKIDPYDDDQVAPFYRAATAYEIEKIEAEPYNSGIKHKRVHDKSGDIITVFELPADAEEREVPVKDFTTFEEYAGDHYGYEVVIGEDNIDRDGAHKYGYILKTYGGFGGGEDTIKVVNRTNPDAKWDWYVVGGRWAGELILKEGAESGIQGNPSWGMDPTAADRFDGAKKGDIDFDTLRANAKEGRKAEWAKVMEKMRTVYPDATDEELDAMRYRLSQIKLEIEAKWEADGRPGRLWDVIEKEVGEKDHKVLGFFFGWFDGMSETQAKFDKIEDWIDNAVPLHTYAMMIDGKWIGKGDMSSWGMSSNESDPNEWQDQVMRAIEALPDDHELVYVDCHI